MQLFALFMVSTYSRLAQLLPRQPIPQSQYKGILSEIKSNYTPPPQIVANQLQDAAVGRGLKLEVRPELSQMGVSGQITDDGILQLSPGLNKGKAKVLAHELGHWEMNHRGQHQLPVWTKELEAEAIATDVLARVHPEKLQQHLDYGATYIGGQIGWNPHRVNLADELLMREEALRKAADYIIQSGIPSDIRNRSAMAMRMTKGGSPGSETTSYDNQERWAFV